MTASEVPFSDIQNRGKATLEAWRRSGRRALRLTRRDDEDLVLLTATRSEQEHTVVSAATKMFLALMQRDNDARTLITDVIPEAFPWARFLPREDVQEFVVELVQTLRAAESIDNPAPVIQVIDSWRHTAEIHADPELASQLASPTDLDLGPVPAPVDQA